MSNTSGASAAVVAGMSVALTGTARGTTTTAHLVVHICAKSSCQSTIDIIANITICVLPTYGFLRARATLPV